MRAVRVLGVTVAVGVLVGTGFLATREDALPGQRDAAGTSSKQAGAANSATSNTAKSKSAAKSTNPVTDGDGSEVIRQPEGTKAKGLPGLRPVKRAVNASFLTAPLPASASSVGGVAEGFPVKIIPVLDGAAVQSSGVATTSTTMQVSIVASGSRSPAAILAFYRKALSAHGFTEASAPAVGGSTASKFERGADHLVVTTTARGKSTTYSLFGTLHVRARG